MKLLLSKYLRKYAPQPLWNFMVRQRSKILLNKWLQSGRPVPPPHIVKQLAILDYQKKFGHQVLIETGTYRGDMVEAQRRNFKKVISIELSDELYRKATKRFRNNRNVSIVQGDSGRVLPQILTTINEPSIFWLDGHYSAGVTARGEKDCPIFEEINAIFAGKQFDHVLLIDDARCFIGKGDYPTVEELTNYVRTKNGRYQLEVKDDIIRYTI